MTDLSLTTHMRIIGAIVDAVLEANIAEPAPDAFVFTPTDPLPPRRVVDGEWQQDAPTFAKVKRVRNWGWLRRQAYGFTTDALVHPAVGTAFYVRTWRYGKSRHLGMAGTGPMYAPHERFSELMSYRDCIFIARLSDGRYFADAWASRSVLYDALSQWRNVKGYLVDWQELGMHDPPTCAIGGADWRTIPDLIAEHHARVMRERERMAS